MKVDTDKFQFEKFNKAREISPGNPVISNLLS